MYRAERIAVSCVRAITKCGRALGYINEIKPEQLLNWRGPRRPVADRQELQKAGLLIRRRHGRIMTLERWRAVGVSSAYDELGMQRQQLRSRRDSESLA